MTTTTTVKGEFDVSLMPIEPYFKGSGGINLGRMSIEKTYQGDLSATGKGEMLTTMTPTEGSAGYVAMEQVQGTLDGKQGSFVLQHYGIMHAGDNNLILEVVPESGTGDFASISGKMTIRVEDGRHYYTFEYNFPV